MSDQGPLPNWLAPVSRTAAVAYSVALRIRNKRFSSVPPLRSAPVPVVSVGNITVGGTGKSPFVRWCAATLQSRGHSPVIAMRGYRSHGGRSDEAMEYQALLPEVPVAVGANRAVAIQEVIRASPSVDCAILDDGFQHRQLARKLDVVLVDATRHCLQGQLIPAGWLREPATALQRADLVVVTRAAAVDPVLEALVERFHGRPPVAWCQHAWVHLDVFQSTPSGEWVSSREPVSWLSGRRVVAAAALGHPAPFLNQLEVAGARVHHTVLRRDHAPYSLSDARRLSQLACQDRLILATTWKDWTKLSAPLAQIAARDPLTVVVPRVEIKFACGEAELVRALQRAVASQ